MVITIPTWLAINGRKSITGRGERAMAAESEEEVVMVLQAIFRRYIGMALASASVMAGSAAMIAIVISAIPVPFNAETGMTWYWSMPRLSAVFSMIASLCFPARSILFKTMTNGFFKVSIC